MLKLTLSSFLAWVPMVFIAILNGAIRQGWYAKHVTELRAHQISTVTGIALFAAYMWALFRVWKLASLRQALLTGFLWLGFTVAFEFLFGRYVMGHAWSRLLKDYDVAGGRLWPLVLVWTAAGPYIFFRLRK
jgi:hypothetical protein